jgi:hypothetical protein
MARKKTSMTVYLTQEQYEALRTLSGSTRVPVSVYIRDGIDLVLKVNGVVIPETVTEESPPENV